MTFTEEIFNYITSACESQNATDDTLAEYKTMKYPRLIPMFKIETKRYYIKDYGSVMIMSTSAMGGLMKLMTISCTPYEGKDVPYLLIDCMHMLKTNLAYVEYYDCTNKNLTNTRLDNLKSRYASIPNSQESGLINAVISRVFKCKYLLVRPKYDQMWCVFENFDFRSKKNSYKCSQINTYWS